MNQDSWTHLNQVELKAPRLLPEGESFKFGFTPATKTTANTRFRQAQTQSVVSFLCVSVRRVCQTGGL